MVGVSSILIALCLSGLQKPAGAAVSLDIPAQTVKAVLTSLEEADGVTLRALEPLNEEVVTLHCENRPIGEILERLADALRAEWSEEKGLRVLKRSKESQSRLEADDRRMRANALKPQLKQFADSLIALQTPYLWARSTIEELKRTTNGEYKVGVDAVLRYSAPAETLLKQLVVAMGSDRLAALPYFHHVTFARRPNPAEEAIGKGTEQSFAHYEKTLEALAQVNEEDLKLPDPYLNDRYRLLMKAARRGGGIGQVLLSAIWFPGRISLILRTFATDGTIIETASQNLTTNDGYPAFGQAVEPTLKRPSLKLGDPAASILSILSGVGNEYYFLDAPRPDGELTPGARAALLNPEETDPLALGAAQAVRDSFEVQGRPFLAVLPDALLRCAIRATKEGILDSSTFAKEAQDFGGLKLETRNGWTFGTPNSSLVSERTRVHRQPLGVLMRRAVADQKLTIRAKAKFVAAAGEGSLGSPLAGAYQFLLPKCGAMAQDFQMPSIVLMMLGNLPDTHWAQLVKGETLDAASLSAGFKTWFRDWANWGPDYYEWLSLGAEGIRQQPAKPLPDLMRAGAEWMPTGVPTGTSFRLNVGQRHQALNLDASSSSGTWIGHSTIANSADEIGHQVWYAHFRNPDLTPQELLKGRWSLRLAEEFELEARAPTGLILNWRYKGLVLGDENSGPVRFDEAPPSFRERVMEVYELMKKRYGG
ncbi:MAG: hypothetical protein HZC36_16900 [Armatimonadetes bacterium]|nr:hypothetical protein [Armatimonadota bacterium]